MSTTLDNGTVVPVNSDAYAPTADMATMGNSLGVITNAANATAMNALATFTGRTVRRLDLNGELYWYNGSAWQPQNPHSEWTFAASGIPSATTWGTGALTNDATPTTDTGFVTTPSNDHLTLRDAGTYSVELSGSFGVATTGRAFYQIAFTNGGTPTSVRSSVSTGEDGGSICIPNLKVTAGAVLTLSCFLTLASGTTTWTGRVRVRKVG
jgi:hypothetical protein